MKIQSVLSSLVILLLLPPAIRGQTNGHTVGFTNSGVKLPSEVTSALTNWFQSNAIQIRPDGETRGLLREAMRDAWFKKDVLFSTIFGGALAVLGGFGASLFAHKLQGRAEKSREREFVRRLLRAIRCELEAASAIYDNGIGKNLAQTKDGGILFSRLSLTQNFFTIYEANASNLG